MRLLTMVVAGLGTFLVACGGGGGGQEPALTETELAQTWVLRDRVGTGKPIDAIALGSAGYVAITHEPTFDGKANPARNNIAAVSVDGLNWAEVSIVPDGHYNSIAFGRGRYVAVGSQFSVAGAGVIIGSTDGRTWTRAAEIGAVLRRVRFTERGFIGVAMNGSVATSPDGVAWTETPSPDRGFLFDANFGAGRFVAGGLTLSVGSADGRQWTTLMCGPTLPCSIVVDPGGTAHNILQIYTVEFGNGIFVTEGVAGMMRSNDATTWTRVGEARSPLGFAAGHFLALNPEFRLSDSRDGEVWTDRAIVSRAQTDDTCMTARCLLLPAALLVSRAAGRQP
jgi:hypothetical protein